MREVTKDYQHPFTQTNPSETKLQEFIQEKFDENEEMTTNLQAQIDLIHEEEEDVVEMARAQHRAKLMDRFSRHEDYYKKHVDGDLEALADKFLVEKFGAPQPEFKEGEADAIDHVEVDGAFEQGSMFQPHFEDSEGKSDATDEATPSGGQSQVQQSTQDGDVVNSAYNMGSPTRFRRFNEGLYSLKHAEKNEMLEHLPPRMLKQYRKVAANVTQQRRTEFIQIRDAERAKPKHERTPYFLDERGRLVPYDKDLVAKNRAAMKLPIPETEPTFEEH